jgi:UDP-N-acetylglucosamine 2-epimerase (non-hydrolysing)
LLVPLGHVEAGLRSGDRTMPEEVNRLVTDQLADVLFTPSADADAHLKREGIPAGRIHRIGNVMIDTLCRLLPQATLPPIDGLADEYCLVTLHRPSNVDDPTRLNDLLDVLDEISNQCQVVFPVHPRTRQRIGSLGRGVESNEQFLLVEPVGYLEFIALQRSATFVATDSGGVQEETTYLGVPCLTLRENTERPVTVDVGSNTLVGNDLNRFRTEVNVILAGHGKRGRIPDLWDGRAAKRIADVLCGSRLSTLDSRRAARKAA